MDVTRKISKYRDPTDKMIRNEYSIKHMSTVPR